MVPLGDLLSLRVHKKKKINTPYAKTISPPQEIFHSNVVQQFMAYTADYGQVRYKPMIF